MRSVVLPIIITTIVAYLLQIFIPGFTELFMLVSADVLTRPWILITSIFLHSESNPMHLLFNMYGVWLFGSLLEQRIGPKKFLFIYLVSGLIAGIGGSFFYSAAVGASGALYGIIGALVVIMPNLKLFFLVFPMTLRTLAIIWVALDFFGFVSSGIQGSNIGHAAHLAGIAFGFIYMKFLYKKHKQVHKRVFHKKKKDNDSILMTQEEMDDYIKYGRL